MSHAARITDKHTCPAHGAGPVESGSSTVNIGFQPAGRATDTLICAGIKDAIAKGASNVFTNHRQATRVGDPTLHGGVIAAGCPTVNIGTDTQSFVLAAAAVNGTPFCEICEKKKREREEAEKKKKAKKEAKSAAEEDANEEKDPSTIDAQPPADAVTTPSSPDLPEGTTPFTPTDDEVALAKAEGNSLEQRVAREKVVRDFYRRHKDDGLGQQRADQDLGVGGAPPRPNKHPLGFGIDLSKPLEQVKFPQPDTATQFVRNATGRPGNFFDPLGRQNGNALGINTAPNIRELKVFALPQGAGLKSTAGPIIDDFTDKTNPTRTTGGGIQLTVPNSVRNAARPVR